MIKFLFVLLFLVSCNYQPKFKIGDCYTNHDRMFKIYDINDTDYFVYLDAHCKKFPCGSMVSHEIRIVDNNAKKVTCPKGKND